MYKITTFFARIGIKFVPIIEIQIHVKVLKKIRESEKVPESSD